MKWKIKWENLEVGEGKNTLKHNHISTIHCPLSSEGESDGEGECEGEGVCEGEGEGEGEGGSDGGERDTHRVLGSAVCGEVIHWDLNMLPFLQLVQCVHHQIKIKSICRHRVRTWSDARLHSSMCVLMRKLELRSERSLTPSLPTTSPAFSSSPSPRTHPSLPR